ncbi:MAG: hypothetical protein J3K34DRAFT_439584 [Monoraphidium minutum]|nr:MAG: hypothetical protein J3K34DRAFT_439584 [Monoraphidium minutum]
MGLPALRPSRPSSPSSPAGSSWSSSEANMPSSKRPLGQDSGPGGEPGGAAPKSAPCSHDPGPRCGTGARGGVCCVRSARGRRGPEWRARGGSTERVAAARATATAAHCLPPPMHRALRERGRSLIAPSGSLRLPRPRKQLLQQSLTCTPLNLRLQGARTYTAAGVITYKLNLLFCGVRGGLHRNMHCGFALLVLHLRFLTCSMGKMLLVFIGASLCVGRANGCAVHRRGASQRRCCAAPAAVPPFVTCPWPVPLHALSQ